MPVGRPAAIVCTTCHIAKPEKGGKCRACFRLYHKRRSANRQKQPCLVAKQKDMKKQRRLVLKRELFEQYGGCECCWCGDTDIRALSLDHANNDGKEHRKSIGGGYKLYSWLRKNSYPQDPRFQVLCMSCHFARHLNGGVLPDDRKDRLREIPADAWFERAGIGAI